MSTSNRQNEPTHPSRGTSVGLAAGVLALLVVATAGATASRSCDVMHPSKVSDPSNPEVSDVERTLGGGGVGSRPVDSARRGYSWRADQWSGTFDNVGSAQEFLNEMAPVRSAIAGWATGYADDSEFGAKIVECRRRHQRSLGETCNISMNVAVEEREDDGAGRYSSVVGVQAVLDDSMGAACFQMAECVGRAWEGRRGPSLSIPANDVVQLEFWEKTPSLKPEAIRDLTDAQLADVYRSCVEETTRELEEMKAYFEKLLEEGGADEFYMDNYLITLAFRAARIADCQLTFEILSAVEDSP
jgi:hypothetical protein